MLLWIMFAGLTAAVLVVILRPVFGVYTDVGQNNAPDLAVYTGQLNDLDRQFARGQVDAKEYDALKLEIARRILRVRTPVKAEVATSVKFFVPGTAAALVPLICLGLYSKLGSPNLPSRPFVKNAQTLANASAVELIAKVERRLASHPEDGRGWDAIAPIYFRMRRFVDAAEAYDRATRLLGETTQRLAGFAEASVLANDGIVTEPARSAYEKLSVSEPDLFEPRFWLALAKEQDGRRDAAAADYRMMLAAAPADVAWRSMVEQRLAAISLPAAPLRGPTERDVMASVGLSELARGAMIDGMVDKLAARLKIDGSDVEGWKKLIVSYMTLKQPERATAALIDARKALVGNPVALGVLAALAISLELKP